MHVSRPTLNNAHTAGTTLKETYIADWLVVATIRRRVNTFWSILNHTH